MRFHHSILRAGVLAAVGIAVAMLPGTARADTDGGYSCSVLGTAIPSVTAKSLHVDYMGVRYYMCCGGCPSQFSANPTKYIKAAAKTRNVIGASLFDPVTTARVLPDKAVAHADYGNVRYFFASKDDLATFNKDPKKYTVTPKSEVLYCAVMNQKIASSDKASNYSDLKGVRYYFCCTSCKAPFDKNPSQYTDGLDARIKAATPSK
ncbi:MAG: YHS domain-containing protein [Armatimonadetes bacterium]|nr:YHS domain-containing protein [Armatimonadota bacterium]MDE2207411.1 YHS domain-containing protein [Armatimonadota bacterium]